MSIASFQNLLLKQREREVPATFSWNGSTYPCVAGSITRGGTLEEGGVRIDYDLSLTVRRELFTVEGATSLPRNGQGVVHRFALFKIKSVVDAGTGSHLRLLCDSANKGS
jgi:hypothetical protein